MMWEGVELEWQCEDGGERANPNGVSKEHNRSYYFKLRSVEIMLKFLAREILMGP